MSFRCFIRHKQKKLIILFMIKFTSKIIYPCNKLGLSLLNYHNFCKIKLTNPFFFTNPMQQSLIQQNLNLFRLIYSHIPQSKELTYYFGNLLLKAKVYQTSVQFYRKSIQLGNNQCTTLIQQYALALALSNKYMFAWEQILKNIQKVNKDGISERLKKILSDKIVLDITQQLMQLREQVEQKIQKPSNFIILGLLDIKCLKFQNSMSQFTKASTFILQKSQSMNRDSPDFHAFLAFGLHQKNKFKQAEDNIKKGLLKDPKHFTLLIVLEQILKNQKKHEDLKTLYGKLIQCQYNTPKYLQKLALIHFQLKQFQKAEQCLQKCLQIDSYSQSTLIFLSKVLFQRKKYGKAKQFLGKLLQKNPKSSTANILIGKIQLFDKKHQEAMNYFKNALDTAYFEQKYQAYKCLAKLYLTQENYKEAETYLTKCINEDIFRLMDSKQKALIYSFLAKCLFQQKNYQKCEQYFKLSLEEDPTNISIIREYTNFLMKVLRFQQSEPYFQKILQFGEDDPVIYQNYGNCLMLQGKVENALQIYSQASQIFPMNPQIQRWYGKILCQLKMFEKSQIVFTQALKSHPDNTDLNYQFALMLFSQKRYKQARMHYDKSDNTDPIHISGAVLLHFYLNEVEEVIKKCEKVRQIFKQNSIKELQQKFGYSEKVLENTRKNNLQILKGIIKNK